MDLLSSAIILILLALLWAGVIFLIYIRFGNNQSRRDQIIFFGGLILFVGMILVVVAGTAAYEYIESTEFCGTFCHIMEPYYDSYVYPDNNTFMENHIEFYEGCSYCHEGPGIIGKVQGLIRAIPEAYYYYTNTYDPENLGGEIPRDYCLKCHDNTLADKPGFVETTEGKGINPHIDKRPCIDCHIAHHLGFGLKDDTCSLCHGTSIDNFELMITNHGNRVGIDCMECHNRVHPDNARISFYESPEFVRNDFCSDCHSTNVERLNMELHESESCVDCHAEHRMLTINFNYCFELCHTPVIGHDDSLFNCSVCHDLSTIHLEPGIDLGEKFSDIICYNCHAQESDEYDSTFTDDAIKIYGENSCIECHSEHKSIRYPHPISSPYDDCVNCHSTYNTGSSIHYRNGISYINFPNINNNFCSDCHSEDYKRFTRELHNSLNCTDCHSDHLEIKIKFNKCASCHDLPSDHDSSLKSCSGSLCHNEFRAVHSEI